MVGGEESLPTVQHARPAARTTGRQLRSSATNTAAPAWDRAPGVVDSQLMNSTLQKPTTTYPITHTLTCTGTLWYESTDRAEKLESLQILTHTH